MPTVAAPNPLEVVLTADGFARLEEELARLRLERADAADRLRQALGFAGDLGDNPEYQDARGELDLIERRVALLEERLQSARLLEPGEPSSDVVTLGSQVVLEDLDDGTCAAYVLVASADSDPSAGRLSNESPVGRAISGHRAGEIVDVRAPQRIRHLRIDGLRAHD